MTKYLISFPSEAMVVTDEELPTVSADALAVIEEAKAAGVYVFNGGIREGVDPVLEVPTREEAVEWARKITVTCRCAQELREFMYHPAS